jgi:hypothetical protein
MKTRTGLCIMLCGGMLTGCSSLTDGSLAFWKTPPKMAMTADGEYQRGRQFHLAGQYPEAQKAYLSALAIDPQHAEAKNAMAALIGASGDVDRAIGMLVELGQRHPQSHVYANLGHAYQVRGQLFDARDAYQRAVDLDPGNENARRRLAALEEQLGARAVVDVPAVPAVPALPDTEPVAAPSPAGGIDLVSSGIYAIRYPVASAAIPDRPAVNLLAAPQALVATAPAAVPVAAAPMAAAPVPVSLLATPADSRSSAVPRVATRIFTVELVNGNGVTGLPRGEWAVVRTANHSDFLVRQTRVEYVQPHKPAARRLAEDLGGRPALRPNEELTGTRLRVVLGHDFKDLDDLKQRLATAEPLPAS